MQRPNPIRQICVALSRSRRDATARRQLLRLTFSAIPILAWLTFNAFYLHGMSAELGIEGDIIAGVAGALVVGVFIGGSLYYRWDQRRLDRDSPGVAMDLKNAIFQEAQLLAILLKRFASEQGMEKVLPEGMEVITRRVVLNRLNELGLRDDLAPWLLDILLAPDGHWSRELKQKASYAPELLEVFRWELGLGKLRSLTTIPKYDVADAEAQLSLTPEALTAKASWDIRPERNATDRFFARCWSELIARREIGDVNESDVQRAIEARESILEEGYTKDYLVGASTITEISSPLLWFLASRAYHRCKALSLLVEITTGEAAPSRLRGLIEDEFRLRPEQDPTASDKMV